MFVHHAFILILSTIKILTTVKIDVMHKETFIWPKKPVMSILIACIKQALYLYSTVQYSTVQYSTVQYSTVQYSTVQYSVYTVLCCDILYKPPAETLES